VTRTRNARSWLALAIVVALSALVFAPSLRNGFVNWDDPANLTENWAYRGLGADQIRWMFTTFHMGHYQPLAWVTLGADFAIWGMNPAGYHLTSLLFHLANTLLFYCLALRLIGIAQEPASTPRASDNATRGATDSRLQFSAAMAALLFAIHPMRVESVAWATERRDVVSGFFFLAAVLLHVDAVRVSLEGSRARALRRAVSILAFACALLSKSITATLPALLIVIDIYPLRRLGSAAFSGEAPRPLRFLDLVIEKLPYFVLSAAAVAIGLWGQSATESVPGLEQFGFLDRAALAAYSLAFYLRKTVLPVGLSPAHVLPPRLDPLALPFLASAALVASVTVLVIALRRRWPSLAATWATYAISLSPVLGIVQVWRQHVAVRYSYLACLGLALLAGGAVLLLLRRRGANLGWRPVALAIPLVAVLSFLTQREIRAWHDSEALWKHAIAIDADNYVALANLGAHESISGRDDAATVHFREALRAHPGYGDALAGLGAIALRAGEIAEASSLLTRALEASNASHPAALSNLGVVYLERGEIEEAIAALRKAVEIDPAFFDAWLNLSTAYSKAGDLDEAIAALRVATRLNPEHGVARKTLASLLFHDGNAARDPSDFDSANLAAWILATSHDDSLRDADEATRWAERAIAATGETPPPHILDTYAAALAAAGRYREAIAAAQRAIERAGAAGDSAQLAQSRSRLALYERGEPFRAD
jgi:tetratricopeptide (TPR) repeat protein